MIQKKIIGILIVACILLASQFWENRGRAETHDGMNLVPTFNTKVDSVDLNFINTLNEQHLSIYYSIEHINNTKDDSLAFVIPYEGTLYQEYPGWKVLPVKDEHATIIYKKFSCSPISPCASIDYQTMDFVFSQNIDSKDSYTHSLAIPFSNSMLNSKIQDIVFALFPHEKVGWNQDGLKTTVSLTLKQETTILNAIPPPEPNFFLVHSTNQTNNVLQWYVNGDHLIYLNYEIPTEKNLFFIITSISFVLFGVGMTLLVTTTKLPSIRSSLNSNEGDSGDDSHSLPRYVTELTFLGLGTTTLLIYTVTTWGDKWDFLTKLGTGITIIGVISATYVAIWSYQVEERRRHQEKEENTYYKMNLKFNLDSLLSHINLAYSPETYAITDQAGKEALHRTMPNNINSLRKSVLEICSEMQLQNLNPFVPAEIKDFVGQTVLLTRELFPDRVLNEIEVIANCPPAAQVHKNIFTILNHKYMKNVKEV